MCNFAGRIKNLPIYIMKELALKYGCNPNQKPSRIFMTEGELPIEVINGHQEKKRFTVRKMSGTVGVERIFPLESPNIESIEVNKVGKVRRAKLYYLRKLTGKAARIKEKRSGARATAE